MSKPVFIEAEIRRYGDAIKQHADGIEAAASRIIGDIQLRAGNLATLKAEISAQTDPAWTSERKASLISDIEECEAFLASEVQRVHSMLAP